MHRFYCKPCNVTDSNITLTGDDVNHIKNVLRMRCEDELVICNGNGIDYYCRINMIESDCVVARIEKKVYSDAELPIQIKLYQGLPKKDKMDLIVQKAVELGVASIIPVIMKRCVVKLEDEKKETKKLERWQAIAEAAAKQSGRGIIPNVTKPISYRDAILCAKKEGMILVPYELASGMDTIKKAILQLQNNADHKIDTVSVFIGPEGGFEQNEIMIATENGAIPVSLGKRILRTETAGLTILSILMYEIEAKEDK